MKCEMWQNQNIKAQGISESVPNKYGAKSMNIDI